jgi:hypothetical protein
MWSRQNIRWSHERRTHWSELMGDMRPDPRWLEISTASDFVQQAGMYRGLDDKKIVSVTAADPQGRIRTITIEQAAWNMLQRKIQKQKFKT